MTIEYILAGLVILTLLPLSQMSMAALVTYQQNQMEQETAYPMVKAILDALLLSPGSPTDWGTSSQEPTQLGLASGNAIETYVLDISKVSRLLLPPDSPNYIPPGDARELMGLGEGCNFNLTFAPVLNIRLTNTSNSYRITLVDYRSFRVPNVNISAFYVPNSFENGKMYSPKSTATGATGECTLSFDWLPNHFLVVAASQLGVKSTQTFPSDLGIHVEGNYVFQSSYPPIKAMSYATGSMNAPNTETTFIFAEIEDTTYYVRLALRR